MGMSRVYIRYRDGTVRYGWYQNTADVLRTGVEDTQSVSPPALPPYSQKPPFRPSPEELVDVEVAVDYGGGFWWRSVATASWVAPNCPFDNRDVFEDVPEYNEGLPAWAICGG